MTQRDPEAKEASDLAALVSKVNGGLLRTCYHVKSSAICI